MNNHASVWLFCLLWNLVPCHADGTDVTSAARIPADLTVCRNCKFWDPDRVVERSIWSQHENHNDFDKSQHPLRIQWRQRDNDRLLRSGKPKSRSRNNTLSSALPVQTGGTGAGLNGNTVAV